jgi:hypothetical protein
VLIFLRDWHPVLREPLDLSASASRSAIFALQGEHDAAMRLVFPGVAVFAVRAIDVPRAVDRVFCTAMFFRAGGTRCTSSARSGGIDNSVHITCR